MASETTPPTSAASATAARVRVVADRTRPTASVADPDRGAALRGIVFLARCLRDAVGELGARLHAELPEHLAEVVLDGVRADEQLGGDLPIGLSLRDQAGDLGFLGREVV